MAKRKITKRITVNPKYDSASVNALKCQFLTDMELAGMGASSRKRYLYVIEHLIRYYWCSPDELTEQQVCDYILEYHRKGPAKGTFRLTHFGLRFFFRQTLGRDWDLFKKKMKPLRRMSLPHALGHGDCMRIIHAVRHPVYRNCLLVMYSCGLRLGEAVKIQVSHIDKPTSILTITGKYNRQRLVPIPPTTLQALRDLWKAHRHKQYLFPNRYGKTHVSDCSVRVAFNDARFSAGIKDITPHALRHSFATRL